MDLFRPLADGARPCPDCDVVNAEWCCTMNCSGASVRALGSPPPEISEDWLASVGFKYRDPQERQQFKHWTLRFLEREDYGLYIETTMGGVINREGQHIGKENGWFVWLGREHGFFHIRHMALRSEMVALVEALTGRPWVPCKAGMVPFERPPRKRAQP